jgi:hypothetical protein
VNDLLFDNEACRIVALLINGSWSNPQFVRWSSVVCFSDVVVVQGVAPLAVGSDDPEVAGLLKHGNPMTGAPFNPVYAQDMTAAALNSLVSYSFLGTLHLPHKRCRQPTMEMRGWCSS